MRLALASWCITACRGPQTPVVYAASRAKRMLRLDSVDGLWRIEGILNESRHSYTAYSAIYACTYSCTLAHSMHH